MSLGVRIRFPVNDDARFNALRDEWRSAASSSTISRAGLRVANVLPSFVNRTEGYAFPTDEQLAEELKDTHTKTAKRGLAALEAAHLIERVTWVRRDDKGEAQGKGRRIFLTMPTAAKKPVEVKGQEVKGQRKVKGQKRAGEGTYGCPNIPDSTRDKETGLDVGKLGAVPAAALKTVPSPIPNRPAKTNPYPRPLGWGTDGKFLQLFDRLIIQATSRGEIGAGEIDRITSEAFDRATRELNAMPFFWTDVLKIRDSTMADWFRFRASNLFHMQEAA